MKKISRKQKINLIILGIFLSLIFLEIGMRITGFMLIYIQEQKNKISVRGKKEYRIICYGESTTVWGGDESWPAYLEKILNQKNLGLNFKVINKGRHASTTAYLLSIFESNLDEYNPDMAIAMMGINDEEGMIPYRNAGDERMWGFLTHLKIYKLAKLIFSHLKKNWQKNIVLQDDDKQLVFTDDAEDVGRINDSKEESTLADRYIQRGKFYMKQGQYKEAEEMFRKTLNIDPNRDEVHVYLGACYRDTNKYKKMEEILKKAIEINPKNYDAYLELAFCYREQDDRHLDQKKTLEEAIELYPTRDDAYIEMGWYYGERKEYLKAEEMLKKAIEIDPTNSIPYIELEHYYRVQDKFKEALELSRKAEKLIREDAWFYGNLAVRSLGRGEHALAERYFKKAKAITLKYYMPVTRQNYRTLKELASNNRVVLVCVQYPMRSIEPLKKYFDSTEGMIFVDNEKIFKEAVKKGKYEDYFEDAFAGDFGHCTFKGNELLAKNIADVILKKIFDDPWAAKR